MNIFQAILSSEEELHFSFKDKWLPIIFDNDVQLDKFVKYLSDFIDSCDTISLEVSTMVSSDRIKYILNVMLSEVGQQLFFLHEFISMNDSIPMTCALGH